MERLKRLIEGRDLTVAPVALNAIMARLAEEAGFKALYLSGGSLGWQKCVTEANLTLPEMAQVAVEMRTVCKLPIVLDAGGGWGGAASEMKAAQNTAQLERFLEIEKRTAR